MNFHLLTIFPDSLDSYLNESILKRAQTTGLISIHKHNLRDYTADNHKTVDDTPYGGGAGMVMKVDVLHRALESIKYKVVSSNEKNINTSSLILNTKIVLLSAKGKRWNQQLAQEYSRLENIIFICGRYEGVDERITNFIDEELSIGDFVLTGGELGAAIMIDSITRLLPDALGNADSPINESHSAEGILEYPQYTRPESFEVYPVDANGKRLYGVEGKQYQVPKVLLSGNHAEIEKWRQSKQRSAPKIKKIKRTT